MRALGGVWAVVMGMMEEGRRKVMHGSEGAAEFGGGGRKGVPGVRVRKEIWF